VQWFATAHRFDSRNGRTWWTNRNYEF
jgi:hypothetical protein